MLVLVLLLLGLRLRMWQVRVILLLALHLGGHLLQPQLERLLLHVLLQRRRVRVQPRLELLRHVREALQPLGPCVGLALPEKLHDEQDDLPAQIDVFVGAVPGGRG